MVKFRYRVRILKVWNGKLKFRKIIQKLNFSRAARSPNLCEEKYCPLKNKKNQIENFDRCTTNIHGEIQV